MLRKSLAFAFFGVVSVGTLGLTGCASDNANSNQPYGLTGSQDTRHDRRFHDEKGHYRPDLENRYNVGHQ